MNFADPSPIFTTDSHTNTVQLSITQILTLIFHIFWTHTLIALPGPVPSADLSIIVNLWTKKCPWALPINKSMLSSLHLFPPIGMPLSRSKRASLMHFSFQEITVRSWTNQLKNSSPQTFMEKFRHIIGCPGKPWITTKDSIKNNLLSFTIDFC